MKARITAELVVGRGLILKPGDEVDIAVFGEYADHLLRACAIVLVEPILAVVDAQTPDSPASLI